MKKILKLFVGSLLIIGLVIIGVGCKKEEERQLDWATMNENQIGVYYNLNEETLEVQTNQVVLKDGRFNIFTDGKEYVVNDSAGKELTLSFDGVNVTLEGYGTYTKRNLAKVAEEKQGVYAEALAPTSTVAVRESTVTLSDKSQHILFENETGVYFLANGKENYISFTVTATVASISLDSKTYIITAAPLPVEEGELTKLVRKIIENAKTNTEKDFALEASVSASAKQTIVSGAKDPNKIDLIGAFLGDSQLSATASVNVKDFDITDLSKLLAEIKLQLTAKANGEEVKANVQVNAQDGKVFTKEDKGNPDEAEYSVEDLPSADELAQELMNAEAFDYEGLLAQLAQIEAKLAEIGVKYSDIKTALDTVFSLNENELKINITKEKAQLALLSVQVIVAANLDKVLEEVWSEMSESDKAQYQSFDAFKQGYSTEITNAFVEAQAFLTSMTINECKLEINFNTFATVVKIDVVIPGEEKTKDEQGNETVTCTYNTAIKLNLQIAPVESGAITKVNPADYIYSYDKVKAAIGELLPTLVLPNLSDNATFKKNVSEYDGEKYYNYYLNDLTEAEANAVYEAFFTLTNTEPSAYYSETLIDDEFVKSIYLYRNENKDDTGAVVSYSVSVYISVKANTYVKVTPTIGAGITFDSTFFDGTSAWVEKELNGSLSWEDRTKVAYVLVDGVVYDIVDWSGDYFSVYVNANTTLEFRLAEPDEDYVSISWFGYAFELEGPRYAKSGETVTYTLHVSYGDDTAKANVTCDGETLASNLGEGETFTFTVPEASYYIYFDVTDANAMGE